MDKALLKRCLSKNSDGMGIMFPQGGKLFQYRTMKDFNQIWNYYCNARSAGKPVAIHFRKNTKGDNSLANCHPFKIADGLSMMHNGTIYGMDGEKGVSDSRYFTREVLSKLPGNFIQSDALWSVVKGAISGDRMFFMDYQGNFSIMNESTGVWEFMAKDAPKGSQEGVWFSHTRDREFFMTGKEKKASVWTGGNRYGVGAKKPSNYIHGSEWSRPVGANEITEKSVTFAKKRVENPTKRAKSGTGLEYASQADRLIFVYGELRDDIPGGPFLDKEDAAYVGTGVLQKASLFAVLDPNTEYGVRPGAMQMKPDAPKSEIHGYVLALRGDVTGLLKELDDDMGITTRKEGENTARFYRTKHMVDIIRDGREERASCTVYMATPMTDISPIHERVKSGDWGEYLADLKVADTADSADGDDGSVWIYSALDEDSGEITCLVCNGQDVVPFTGDGQFVNGQAAPTGEIDMYWCSTCMDQYPIELTEAELEEVIHSITA